MDKLILLRSHHKEEVIAESEIPGQGVTLSFTRITRGGKIQKMICWFSIPGLGIVLFLSCGKRRDFFSATFQLDDYCDEAMGITRLTFNN